MKRDNLTVEIFLILIYQMRMMMTLKRRIEVETFLLSFEYFESLELLLWLTHFLFYDLVMDCESLELL